MTRVFIVISYGVLDMPGMFKEMRDFIGEFQIEQTIEQSLNGTIRFWFWTDKVEIKEGEPRQVSIEVSENKEGLRYFKLTKE